MWPIFLNAVLQLIGGTLFGLGVFGGSQLNSLQSLAAEGTTRAPRWMNWLPEYLSPRPRPCRMFYQHFGHGTAICLVIVMFFFIVAPQSGWSWATPTTALLAVAAAMPIAVIVKLQLLRTYQAEVPHRQHETPRETLNKSSQIVSDA